MTLTSTAALRLLLPAVGGSATVRVNGETIGSRGWSPFRFDIPSDTLRLGDNEIQIEVASHAANRYYAGTGMRDRPEPSGLLASPLLTTVTSTDHLPEG